MTQLWEVKGKLHQFSTSKSVYRSFGVLLHVWKKLYCKLYFSWRIWVLVIKASSHYRGLSLFPVLVMFMQCLFRSPQLSHFSLFMVSTININNCFIKMDISNDMC